MSEDQNKQSFDLNNEEDRKKLRKRVGTDINITLDDQNAKKETEELKSEVEDLKGKLGIIAEKALEAKMDKLGISDQDRETFRQNPEMLRGYELGISQNSNSRQQAPSGSAPLNNQQLHGSQGSQGYGSVQEMLDDLYSRERQGDKNATAIIQKLVLKVARGTLKGQQNNEFEKPQEKESGTVTRVITPLTVEDEDESELAKLGIKKDSRRKKARMKALREKGEKP